MAIRGLFAFYSALALPVLVLAVGLAQGIRTLPALWMAFIQPRVLWTTLAGALLVMILILLEPLLSPIRKRAMRSGIYTGLAFSLPFAAVAILLRLGVYFAFDGLMYSVILGAIAGLLRYKEDLSFLSEPSISEDAKRARLDKAYDLIARGLTIFTTLYFLGLIAGAISWVIRLDPKASTVELASIAVVTCYLTAGVIAGVYLRMFRQLQALKDSYTCIRANPETKIVLPWEKRPGVRRKLS